MSLVMFDYDGVIADSYAQFIEDWMRVCRSHGIVFRRAEEAIGLFDGNVYESMRRMGVDDETINRILEEYRATANFQDVELFPGMADALREIAALHRVVIITSNLSAAVRGVLERHGVDCVSEVIGAEREKSKIKKIKAVISRFPELTPYYVGDTRGDMLEGREAGSLTVAVTWGWHTADRLMEGRPDYLVNTPGELVALFKDDSPLAFRMP